MAKYEHVQRSFAGGEISPRMIMRDDLPAHASAVLAMENFQPTLQGTAVRSPGSRYVYEVGNLSARIIPYMSPNNDRGFVEITPNDVPGQPANIQIYQDLDSVGSSRQELTQSQYNMGAPTEIRVDIVPDFNVDQGFAFWDAEPLEYLSLHGDRLGCWTVPGGISVTTRNKQSEDISTATIRGETLPLPADAENLTIAPIFSYRENFNGLDAPYTGFVRVGTAPGLGDIWEEAITLDVGETYNRKSTITGLSLTGGQVLYLTLSWTAGDPFNTESTPVFIFTEFRIQAPSTVDISPEPVGDAPPYTADEIKDIQYIQSPYNDSAPSTGSGKELVLIHPSYPPQRIILDSFGQYLIEAIPFGVTEPDIWTETGYPAACGSFVGRLVLAGSTAKPITGSILGAATETVWCTAVGNWEKLIDPAAPEEVTAEDAIEFTTIYRSPIQWVYGQKTLLIGAEAMEYTGSADGIFAPSDLGVEMHSTHGSNNVQPVGMGSYVLFPADNGTKVRAMQYLAEQENWVAPDMTYAIPELFKTGIVRMVRMRNPHLMTIVVNGAGALGILHQDANANVFGWSRISLSGNAKDACVVTNSDGEDVLYVTVQRWVQGVPHLYVEAFVNWIDNGDWQYLQSTTVFVPANRTDTFTGMDYLEGQRVQVVADGNYIGTYPVESGTVVLVDDIGNPILASIAIIGLAMTSSMITMPIIGQDPGAVKRYSKIYVRTIFSSRPIINGERPADRDPLTLQDESQSIDLFRDNQVAQLGWSQTQPISIRETLPVRCEIIGIFGTVKGNSL